MDERQARRLVDRYADTILRISFNWFQQRADTEDICQTVFLKYLTAAPHFQDEEHEKAWIIRTAINACKDYRKSAFFRRTVALEEAAELSAPETEWPELLDDVKRLPKLSRLSIYLYYYEGYSVREIARALGQPEGTVKSWLHRGRELLRRKLEEDA